MDSAEPSALGRRTGVHVHVHRHGAWVAGGHVMSWNRGTSTQAPAPFLGGVVRMGRDYSTLVSSSSPRRTAANLSGVLLREIPPSIHSSP
jgi:hypothetical protein